MWVPFDLGKLWCGYAPMWVRFGIGTLRCGYNVGTLQQILWVAWAFLVACAQCECEGGLSSFSWCVFCGFVQIVLLLSSGIVCCSWVDSCLPSCCHFFAPRLFVPHAVQVYFYPHPPFRPTHSTLKLNFNPESPNPWPHSTTLSPLCENEIQHVYWHIDSSQQSPFQSAVGRRLFIAVDSPLHCWAFTGPFKYVQL